MSILTRISQETGIPQNLLSLIVRSADHRYKSYTIPKASGGVRLIQHPARELKFLQRWVVSGIFKYAPIHSAATAYRRNASIRNNATIHVSGRFFLKIDFENFFASIRFADVKSLLEKVSPNLPFLLSEEDIDVVAKLVTRRGELTIGAPSSPIISNAIMYDFDDHMSHLATRWSSVYSRYADDIVFSTSSPRVLENLLKDVRQHLDVQSSPKLRINEKKVAFLSKKRRVRITGLVVDCRHDISIGRAAKRKLKALIHRFVLGKLDLPTTSYLKGYLGYVMSVEPKLAGSLQKKYGKAVLDAILDTEVMRLKRYDPQRLHELFIAAHSGGVDTS
jgi:RNA-directed DNA polymerase